MVKLAHLLLVSTAVLAGCAGAPIEHREPYKTVVVEKPAREVYESLKAFPYCDSGWEADGVYDAYDNSFKVEYSFGGFFGPSYPSDSIVGRSAGETSTELRLTSMEKWRTPISEKFLNRLQTGKCDG
ncbi:Uncharacterised protein [Ectopseudomonas mendocina]|uniref:Lipoprotein n=1 Tax=Ectopseudomonas mendocina TaxID=300 RepID=A0A379PP82_ECTME|nr:hypothetical protein [Pseudomonas mendocina]SUE95889.1 Uncharacterised protein [Pseudomonas mendocina]